MSDNLQRNIMYKLVSSKLQKDCTIFQKLQELPWWYYGWESACQCRGYGFDLWFVKIPHAMNQLSPSVTTEPVLRAQNLQLLKPVCLGSVLCEKRSHCKETPQAATKSSSHSPQLEKACMQQPRPSTTKNK